MKRHLTKLGELQAHLLVLGIVGIILLALSTIGIAFGQYGWMIGALAGTIASMISAVLTDVGSKATLKEGKTFLYLACYFVRMVIFVGLFATLVILQYKVHVDVFTNSFWGMLIAFLPSTLVTIMIQLKYKGEAVH